MPLNQERFKQLALQAGFNPEPEPEDAEAVMAIEKARTLFALACEESVQAAAMVFHGDRTVITHADAVARSTLAIRSLYTDDVLFSLADPHYVPGPLRP